MSRKPGRKKRKMRALVAHRMSIANLDRFWKDEFREMIDHPLPRLARKDRWTMKLVVLSDTHFMHEAVKVPDGDVLIHCGDWSGHGTNEEAALFVQWLGRQPHRHKVFISGNHDWQEHRFPGFLREMCKSVADVHYLKEHGVTLDGMTFWGSPWVPRFYNWAFMEERSALEVRWEKVLINRARSEKHGCGSGDIDVLITHGPPYGHGDLAPGERHVGDLALLDFVSSTKPKVHCFGHIHEGHGITFSDALPETMFVNAAICDGSYDPINKPWEIDL